MEVVSLNEIASTGLQFQKLRRGFYAFGNEPQAQGLAKTDDGAYDGSAFRMFLDAGDECRIDLQHADRQPGQLGQRRIPRPEIVDCDMKPKTR